MKPTDDFQDEALQRALQRKFGDFESAPSPSVTERVLSGLKNLPQDTTYRFPALILLFLSLGIGGWVAGNFWPSDQNRIPALTSRQQADAIPPRVNQPSHVQPGTTPHSLRAIAPIPLPVPKGVAADYPVIPPYRRADKEKVQKNPDPVSIHTPEARTPVGPVSLQAHRLLPRPYLPPAAPALPEVKWMASDLTGQLPADRPFTLRAVLSFTPTNTFQRLTVLPQANVRFQNFRLPAALSPQTFGYTVQAGLESRGVQLLIQYSRFQQDVRYEIESNAYLITSQQAQGPHISREGIPQSERLTFQLVGVALHKRHPLRNFLTRDLFLDTGASLSHDLATGKSLGWGTVGVGKSLPVTPYSRVALIPNLGFSLNRLSTNQEAFRSRYFQVGLSVEVTIGMK